MKKTYIPPEIDACIVYETLMVVDGSTPPNVGKDEGEEDPNAAPRFWNSHSTFHTPPPTLHTSLWEGTGGTHIPHGNHIPHSTFHCRDMPLGVSRLFVIKRPND